MLINGQSPSNPLAAAFLELLQTHNSKCKETSPEVPLASLVKAFNLIENVALYGAALEANLASIIKQLTPLFQEETVSKQKLMDTCGGLMALKTKIMDPHFTDVRDFCSSYERMVRDKILENSGIDPKDDQAVLAFLRKKSQETFLAKVSTQN